MIYKLKHWTYFRGGVLSKIHVVHSLDSVMFVDEFKSDNDSPGIFNTTLYHSEG